MKFFAFFLPQFHEIPENNEWWGEGFTEWVNVKKAQSLFKGHIQPKHPLDNNYYNLLEKSTMEWQTKLMKDYGISGMIYYHYYFEGRMLLEKPAENLLKWTDIDQPFFFCWANHSWNRAWEGKRTLLLEQTYGDENAWEAHFQYLLPFFKDSRYEKKNNKPVFMLYQPLFDEKKSLFDYFDKRCKENGFDGLYLIETCIKSNKEYWDKMQATLSNQCEKIFMREPSVSQNIYMDNMYSSKFSHLPEKIWNRLFGNKAIASEFDANKLFDIMCNNQDVYEDTYRGLFFEWDNTPRHSQRGYVIKPVDLAHFNKYLNLIKDDEYCFINAWNEWAEGMMLEPTVEHGYKYLEMIKEWKRQNEQ